uniref:CHHC U11-48K-type domain-containing protein n=1 Tax=Anolis carolinensis TaxID=28377 RepID=A0A803TNH7_ANOCA
MDPEKLLQCPYDKNHQIRASRFPYHLVKCKKNNEKIAKQLVTCPYNARHRIPKDEFNSHIEICESKISSEEDWEADADEASVSPFGCILSPDLFNLYESKSGVKISERRNINHLRYAEDITLMAESEEELRSLITKVKEESCS